MKAGLAAFMIAGKALKTSGVKLKGDVVLAAVVGEISRTPIGPWQSQDYRGEGVGTRHLLTHGMHTDYAVCCRWLGLEHRLDAGRRRAGEDHHLRQGGGCVGNQARRLSDGTGQRDREDDQDHRRDRALGRGVRGEAHLSIADRALVSQGQYRRHRRRRALPAELLSRASARSMSTSACRRRCARLRSSTRWNTR